MTKTPARRIRRLAGLAYIRFELGFYFKFLACSSSHEGEFPVARGIWKGNKMRFSQGLTAPTTEVPGFGFQEHSDLSKLKERQGATGPTFLLIHSCGQACGLIRPVVCGPTGREEKIVVKA